MVVRALSLCAAAIVAILLAVIADAESGRYDQLCFIDLCETNVLTLLKDALSIVRNDTSTRLLDSPTSTPCSVGAISVVQNIR